MENYYPMEREINQILWATFMYNLGNNWDNTYENDTFIVKAYDWADIDDESNEWHFWHKPSGLKVQWYKYPLRGVMCNMSEITHKQFLDVLKDCHNSMEDGNVKFLYDCDKWWK